jgi:hypothetical protein
MASLWKHPKSKYWVGCYTAADGRQLKRSTRETDKRKAQVIADAWDRAESLGSMGLLTLRNSFALFSNRPLSGLQAKNSMSLQSMAGLLGGLKPNEVP